MDANDPKLNALLQLLSNQAAEKVLAEIVAGLTPEERREVAMEALGKWSPANDQYSEFTKSMNAIMAEAMKDRRDDIKQLMLAKVDALKSRWVDEQMGKWVRGY